MELKASQVRESPALPRDYTSVHCPKPPKALALNQKWTSELPERLSKNKTSAELEGKGRKDPGKKLEWQV